MRWYHRPLHVLMAITLTIFVGTVLMYLLNHWQDLAKAQSDPPSGLSYEFAYLKEEVAVADLLRLPDSAFTGSDWNQIPLGFSDQTYWLRITLDNQTSSARDLVLVLDNPMINRLEVFSTNADGLPEPLLVTGDQTQNPVRLQLMLPHVPFRLSDIPQRFYIKAQTNGAPIVPVTILTADGFNQLEQSLHLIWGSFCGIILLMVVYNLVLYMGLKDETYVYYSGYIFSLLLLLGVAHGYGYYLFPRSLQQWLSANIISLNALATLMTFLFASSFLRYSAEQGPLSRVMLTVRHALWIYLAFTLVAPEHIEAQIYPFIQAVGYVVVMAMILYRIPEKLTWTRYYIISWLPLYIGGAIAFLLFSGDIEYSFLTRHAFLFSIVLEMALISMALADRFSTLEKVRLYQATHDEVVGLANTGLLKEAIKTSMAQSIEPRLTLVAIEISNLDSIRPYLRDQEMSDLFHAISQSFDTELSGYGHLHTIDDQSVHHRHCAVLRGEILCFLMDNHSRSHLDATLKALSQRDNYNPMPDSLPFRIQCHFAGAILQNNTQATELLRQVRHALQTAKTSQQAYHIYQPLEVQSQGLHVRLAQDLVNAIEAGDLELYHQPQISLTQPEDRASEVLLRWHHPTEGLIPTIDVITIAEQTGLIRSLTRWVLSAAFSQTKTLRQLGYCGIRVSINISANDLSHRGFSSDVIGLLDSTGLPADIFTLEVTESMHLSDQAVFQQNFTELRDHGFLFAIDDFGTGYSSLSYANEHPFSELKIDRSFVTDMLNDPKRQTIVSATVSMAKKLKLIVTAEGIEDDATAETLKALGCDKLQGFGFARPMPFSDYQAWLNEQQGPLSEHAAKSDAETTSTLREDRH
ncbi:EAL domain-containing protein [Reinekea blandensis]|uniref:Predicted signal transduction protein containing sensor and EAL domains n=1 Tax=Reinekea blandensis MED297 TaxID=314283 RepID=A4BC31_9GAMM|nr:EAL domain-containing protein [Reinekea blandensis]EAR10516.1 predicted signal transduction protein containing sensor and EAL domains [Reinekea sp. MED297] [Reinekea blandensis MED297]